MTPHRHLIRVVLWMTGALLSFSVMAVSIRALSRTFTVLEMLTARAVIGLILVGLLLIARPRLWRTIKTERLGLHILRNGVHFGSQYLWAVGLLLLPLATVFALEFTMPAWTIVLAPFFLGERMTVSRIGAVVLGLVGVLVILRPGVESFRPASLIVLVAALGYAAQSIATKKLTATESTLAIVAWMNVIQFALGLVGTGLLFASKIEAAHAPALIGLGTAGVFAHLCLSNAFRAGEASLVIPLDFMRIPLIAVVGWWFYQEPLDVFVFAGAGLIILGIVWNLHSETRHPIGFGATRDDQSGPPDRTSR